MGSGTRLGAFLKSTPNVALLICATVLGVVLITSFTILAWGNKDATELRSLINTMLNIAGVVLGSGGLLYSSIAARKSSEAAENTNGKMDEKIKESVKQAHIELGEGGNNGGQSL
jgi:hypothetical protein